MMRRFRHAIAAAAAAAWLSTPAGAQQPPQGHAHDHDTDHRDMLTRGAQAMGFDQERTVHHFLLHDHRTGDSGVVQQTASGRMNGMGPGMRGRTHDAATMVEMRDIHQLFVNHDRITRTVTNLPNGIQTVTESADPRIAQLIKAHVASSNKQVESGKDPGLPMESAALHAIFEHYDTLRTTVETTATGVIVTQTSSDSRAVAALQQHASEVTGFVEDGLAAMHAAMMKNGSGMMPHGMHRGMMGTKPDSGSSQDPR